MRRALKIRSVGTKRRNKQIKVFGVQGDFFKNPPVSGAGGGASCRVWAAPAKTKAQEAEPPVGCGRRPQNEGAGGKASCRVWAAPAKTKVQEAKPPVGCGRRPQPA